jgi:hypothetical protein
MYICIYIYTCIYTYIYIYIYIHILSPWPHSTEVNFLLLIIYSLSDLPKSEEEESWEECSVEVEEECSVEVEEDSSLEGGAAEEREGLRISLLSPSMGGIRPNDDNDDAYLI